MTKQDVRKLAEEYVQKHKQHYKTVKQRDLKAAVNKVAKVLEELTARNAKEESKNTRIKAA